MAVSANALFHFTNSLDNLVSILSSGGFWPRYCIEYGFKKRVAVCQCCFCDIPLSDIQNHTKRYGYFGLGMRKEWGFSNGLSPVLYFIKDSNMGKNILAMAKNSNDNNRRQLLSMLKVYKGVNYHKGINGENTRIINYLYYNEREWRYVPHMLDTKDLCIFIEKGEKEEEKIQKLNEKTKSMLLRFMVDDIKYIVVDDSQINKLLEEIKNMRKYSDQEKELLVSKIITKELIINDI